MGGNLRKDGTPKGEGYFGKLNLPGGGVATEYSIGVDLGDGEVEIPTLVPTLTPAELDTMVKDIIPNKKQIPQAIIDKAIDHAKRRMSEGNSPFAPAFLEFHNF